MSLRASSLIVETSGLTGLNRQHIFNPRQDSGRQIDPKEKERKVKAGVVEDHEKRKMCVCVSRELPFVSLVCRNRSM